MASDEVEKLRRRSISRLDNDAALEHIGTLVDVSFDAAFKRGADRALYLLDELSKRDLTAEQVAISEYFRANAWHVVERVAGDRGTWEWEHPHHERQILALSKAAAHPGFRELDTHRQCQILTNRANQLHAMGRVVDAIEGWDEALRINPKFGMALLNRGYGLKNYAGLQYDDRHRAILFLHAHDSLVSAAADGAALEANDPASLHARLVNDAKEYAAVADFERIRALRELDEPSLGRSGAERAYRQWCLEHRLFLNPLNDVGRHPADASDDLILPPITERIDDRPDDVTPPPIIGFFNQMKQEYASARFILYDALHSHGVHFSDRGVRLFETLDYSLHSFATERIRTAFRIAYSLLDKVAFAIDHYWGLGKVTDRINFKNVWMVEGKARLLDCFRAHRNWPLRGLFWLSKELFDDQLKETTAADARELHDIRNALEHKYLQVHEFWDPTFALRIPAEAGLRLSIECDLLEAKTLRVMKIARSALIQLALAIGVEERTRGSFGSDTTVAASMPLFTLDDRRKRRDPR